MIACPTITRHQIRRHYNLATPLYWVLWGRHVHHGLWRGSESPAEAQQNLIEALARAARVARQEHILDVGCGMGGSAIHLARELGCQVHGVSVSSLQVAWARCAAAIHGVARKTRFQCLDAEHVHFPPSSFDVVWSIECTEHFFDKPAFFHKSAKWLRPGGRVAICAWLAGDSLEDASRAQLVYDVCEGFFCPSLGTSADYLRWLGEAGLEAPSYEDWTDQVSQTWEICARRVLRFGVSRLARVLGRDDESFLKRFTTILEAFRCKAMRYGCFSASVPTP